MGNPEKELHRFANDPRHREKVLLRVRKEQDKKYSQKVKNLELEVSDLKRARTEEIERITDSRWEPFAGGKLMVNRTEGKVRFNQTEVLFSSLCGAEVNLVSGCRIITSETGETKKKASVGGAIAGGMILGPVGAVAGGVGLGKTKSTGNTVMNQIPTCTHLGVKVNVDGFVSEIVIMSQEVDQTSKAFYNAQEQAQAIVSRLGQLAKLPVPNAFILPEEAESVKRIEAQIESKQEEWQAAVADKPKYEIPAMYKGVEHSAMTDKEYLQFLREEDTKRISESSTKKSKNRSQNIRDVAVTRREIKEAGNTISTEGISNEVKKVGNFIYKAVFTILSVLMLLFAVVGFTSEGGSLSGFVFLVAALAINPSITSLINKKLFKYPYWIGIIILIVGFFVGVLLLPVTTP